MQSENLKEGGRDDLRIVARPDLYKARIGFAAASQRDVVWNEGFALPHEPSSADADTDHALYINRYTLLAVSTSPSLAGNLASAFAHHADVLVTDASSALASIDLVGQRAAEVLSRGCALDLREHVFRAGDYACTTLGAIDVTLHRTARGMRLHFRAPHGRYVQQWLASVMAIS